MTGQLAMRFYLSVAPQVRKLAHDKRQDRDHIKNTEHSSKSGTFSFMHAALTLAFETCWVRKNKRVQHDDKRERHQPGGSS